MKKYIQRLGPSTKDRIKSPASKWQTYGYRIVWAILMVQGARVKQKTVKKAPMKSNLKLTEYRVSRFSRIVRQTSNIIKRIRILGYTFAEYPIAMEIIDNIIPLDSPNIRYTDRQILKILILLQIFGISYRSSRIFFINHEEYLAMIGIRDIPSFQTLSRRSRKFDLHAINQEIAFLYSMEECAAMDSFTIHTCRYSTAMRRKPRGNYMDPESGWPRTAKGWTYGRKCHMPVDVDSLLIMDWLVTRGNIHDSRVSHDMDSVRNFSYILADAAYDTSDIYDYIFENTHSLPIIDTNIRRGIVPERLSMNRKIGIDLRREYASLYSLRWEIEGTFSILEEIMRAENIWFTRNRSYDAAIGLKAIAYNLMIISNIKTGNRPREIMKIVSC